jgi:DegV family protein with EDD domain
MEKIGIVTDEAVDLPKEIIEKHRIAVVPVKLFWPEIENLPGENTFQKMRELEKGEIKNFYKTSQPSIKDFLEKYNLQFSRFERILCITLTSKLSGTHNSAIQAVKFLEKNKQDKVFTVDTLNVSGGQALLVLKAIELIEEGKEAEDIVAELKEMVPRVHFYIMFKDPKWIEVSGRISHLVAGLMRGVAKANIRPVLAIKDGIIAPAGLKSGAKDMPAGLFKQFEEDVRKMKMEKKKIKAVITHGDDLPEAERLKKMIEERFGNTEIVFINIVNNVVGALAGPGALTLGWCEN